MATLTVILIVFALLSIVIAWLANSFLPDAGRVPMQWSLNGQVNWSAPRRIALGFFPALLIASLLAHILLMQNSAPRQGQEDMVVPVMLVLAAMILLIQLLHIYLVNRSICR